MKLSVKEGWTNAEGKKGDPRIQFVGIQYLQDVLTTFAKKLILQINIAELHESLIQTLFELFKREVGDNPISIEVMELEMVKRQVVEVVANEIIDVSDESEMEEVIQEVEIAPTITEVEEVKVVTKLVMPSRKIKVKISNELLQELEAMQINFKLN